MTSDDTGKKKSRSFFFKKKKPARSDTAGQEEEGQQQSPRSDTADSVASIPPSLASQQTQPTPLVTPRTADGSESRALSEQASPAAASPVTGDSSRLRRALHVQVISARNIMAADNNGLSDPYCTVIVGSRKLSSRVETKTLTPLWNDHFVFTPDDMEEAMQAGHSYVELCVFDWDMMSADDFLGKALVPFADAEGGSHEPRWLRLYREGKNGVRKYEGEIQVAAWYQEGAERGEKGIGAEHVSLCYPPGLRKRLPLVMRGGGSTLYEEPLMACLAITLERIQGAPMATASFGRSFSQRSERSNALSLSDDEEPQSPKGSKLGRLFRRKKSKAPSVSGLSQSSMGGQSDDDVEDDVMSIGTLDAADLLDATRPGSPTKEDAEALSGHLLYFKLALGRQTRQTFIRKERIDGSADFRQRFVFACPVPLRDRHVALELYRTSSTSRKGRLVASTQIWLSQLLPQLHPDTLSSEPMENAVSKAFTLESVSRKMAGGAVTLTSGLVDQDARRVLYKSPLSEAEAAKLEAQQAQQAGASAAAAAAAADTTSPGAAQRRTLQKMQSATQLMGERERRQRAELTEDVYELLQGRWYNRLAQSTQSMVAAWADSAATYAGFAPPPENLPRPPTLKRAPTAAPGASQAAEGGKVEAPPDPNYVQIKLSSLQLSCAAADCFVVLKCGPHWGRTEAVRAVAPGVYSFDWELSMPLHDPATLLLITVFSQTRKKQSTGPQGGRQLIGANAPQMLGKLRVRLSCLTPNEAITSKLPLLCDRKKGAQEVGKARLTLQVVYPSRKALLKSYLACPLPEVAYNHGVQDSDAQAVMDSETRRIVLRWLDTANPPIPKPVAMAVLDTEREEFIMSRLKVNLRRFRLMAAGFSNFSRWWAGIERWDNQLESFMVCCALVMLAFRPTIVIPLLLAWASYSIRKSKPATAGALPTMEHDPPEIEPEDLELESSTANPYKLLMQKYEMLVGMMLKVQNILDDLATALEKMAALARWEDPTATSLFMLALLLIAGIIYLLGFSFVIAFVLFWIARPPKLRTPTPPPPANLFKRLPSRADRIM